MGLEVLLSQTILRLEVVFAVVVEETRPSGGPRGLPSSRVTASSGSVTVTCNEQREPDASHQGLTLYLLPPSSTH